MKTKSVREKKYFAPQNEGAVHPCDHPGCTEEGQYRAPKDKSLKSYYWFCLKHVQEYNARWNYYADSDIPDEEAQPRRRRRFGGFKSNIRYQFGYDFIDELGIDASSNESNWKERIYFNAKDRENAAVLETSLEDLTLDELKKQYKKLVKKYHPDVNAGNKEYEEKFKKITVAYKELAAKF
jgi:hypothetical protein